MADMEVPVGVRRPIMEDEFLAPARRLALPFEQRDLLPPLENFRLQFGQPAFIGKSVRGRKTVER